MVNRYPISFKPIVFVALIGVFGVACTPPSGPDEPGDVVRVLKGHERAVHAVAFSPVDGDLLISGSLDGSLKTWNTSDGKNNFSTLDHGLFVRDVAFSPDGQSFASAGNDSSVYIRNALGVLQQTIKTPGPALKVAYKPDGSEIAVGTQVTNAGVTTYFIRVYNPADGAQLFSRTTHTAAITDLAYSPDGNFLVSSSIDRTVAVAPTTTYISGLTIDFINPIYAVTFTPDNSHVVVGGVDQFVEFYDAATGDLTLQLKGHKNTIYDLAYNSAGTMLASGSLDNSAKLWSHPDLTSVADPVNNTIQPLKSFSGNSVIIRTLAFNPDGSRLATAGNDTNIRIWKVN